MDKLSSKKISHRVRQVLHYLLLGQTIEFDGREYGMTDDFEFYILAKRYCGNTSTIFEEVPLHVDMSVRDLVSICNKLDDSAFFDICACIALNDPSQHKTRNLKSENTQDGESDEDLE